MEDNLGSYVDKYAKDEHAIVMLAPLTIRITVTDFFYKILSQYYHLDKVEKAAFSTWGFAYLNSVQIQNGCFLHTENRVAVIITRFVFVCVFFCVCIHGKSTLRCHGNKSVDVPASPL